MTERKAFATVRSGEDDIPLFLVPDRTHTKMGEWRHNVFCIAPNDQQGTLIGYILAVYDQDGERMWGYTTYYVYMHDYFTFDPVGEEDMVEMFASREVDKAKEFVVSYYQEGTDYWSDAPTEDE